MKGKYSSDSPFMVELKEEAERIQRFGLTQQEARTLFTQAQTTIPKIQELQKKNPDL